MITPSFGLTVTERVLPKLALDFTTAVLDSRVTFTRSGNTATYINSSGAITAINADLPRFDYNPTTLSCQGLLIEEARTNVILNSLIDGTILNTQIVTTSATAYTLSFYGTGSIVLTGTHSATVTGTGAYPSRKTYTFTPTAGALTLTVSGTVQYAQLETGSFATSFIPTSVASVTRNADVATMTGTNFSSWFNATQGSFVTTFDSLRPIGAGVGIGLLTDISASIWPTYIHSTGKAATYDGTNLALTSSNVPSYPTVSKIATRYGSSEQAVSLNGSARATSAFAGYAGLSNLRLGGSASLAAISGHIQKIFYYSVKFTDNEMKAFST